MRRRINPATVGLFMIGALALAIVGIATFATAGWFSRPVQFISYFDESVNGLDVGAPVKFKGVPVGEVKELRFNIDLRQKKFRVPVVYDVNLSKLKSSAGDVVNLRDAGVRRQQIAEGLRAQLQMESFVTGKLYVELTYIPDAGPPELARVADEFPEIPTRPSLLAALQEESASIITGLQEFDFAALSRDITSMLARTNEMLNELDVKQLNASLLEASGAIADLAGSPEVRDALRQAPAVSAQLNQTLLETQNLIRRVDSLMVPLQGQIDVAGNEMITTLRSIRLAAEQTQGILSTDTGLGYRTDEALTSMTEAAEALRLLARTLEENPGLLIRGR